MRNPFAPKKGGAQDGRGVAPQPADQAADAENKRDFRRTVWFLAVAGSAGVIVLSLGQRWPHSFSTALLWALACSVAGAVIGFLFGIPRVLQQDGDPVRVPAAEGEGPARPEPGTLSYRMQVNTNLEQISDWLTKIIVGIGLVELRRMPDFLNRASGFVAQGIGGQPASRVVAGALIVYFFFLGFLGGYLITRLFLAGAFSRADQGARSLRVVREESRQQLELIADLQSQVARVLPADFQQEMTPPAPTVRRILWVDDNPDNNRSMRDVLERNGVTVDTSTSTEDALAKLKTGSYDRVITDMGRAEATGQNETAGIDLIRKMRAAGFTTPVVVHSSPGALKQHGQAALDADAKAVTSSHTVLLQALDL